MTAEALRWPARLKMRDDMASVRLTALSMAMLLVFSGCRKEPDGAKTKRTYSVAAVVQCFKPGQSVQWSEQIVGWSSSTSQQQALRKALDEINTKHMCGSRSGDRTLTDGACWWIGLERNPRCIPGPLQ